MTAIEVLCNHAARTLPDSLAEKKAVLRAIQKLTVAKSVINRNATAQLANIATLEKFDAQMKLHFKPGNPAHDGNHNGGQS